jgi:hypothetical protein
MAYGRYQAGRYCVIGGVRGARGWSVSVCDRDGGFVAARSRLAWPFGTKKRKKGRPPSVFVYEKRLFGSWKNLPKKNEAGRLSAAAIPLRETRSKRGLIMIMISRVGS